MAKNKPTSIHLFLLVIVAIVFIWSLIKPVSYLSLALETVPVVIAMGFVLATYNKFRLTTLSYVIIAILLILVFIGGHYTFSKVPLFDWIKDVFNLKRNNYDRFGHLLKGLLAIVVREVLLRKTGLTKGIWLGSISVSIVLSIAAIYEILEWVAYIIGGGGKISKSFLGTQGDMWDAQWDMSLALIGSVVTLLLFSKLHNKLLKKERLE
ncbi:MAG: DUF2238 domain-containing protein [Bacillaceae bacterium]